LSSDHKPLDAIFTLEYDAVVPELKSKIQQEVARELDRAENEGRPGITIVADSSQEVDDVKTDDLPRQESLNSAEGIDFGPISFLRRTSRGLTIANTSQVTSTFEFVARPSESGGDQIAPSWLTVSFSDEESGTVR
jgi:phosphatidylinositol-bisphosphatase